MKQCTISIFSMQISVVKLTYTKRRNASLGSNPQARKETGEFGIGSSFCHSPNPPQGHGNIIQYKFLESFSGDLILKNLILRLRLCGTCFITQSSCFFHCHLTEICQAEMFCTTVVPAPNGHLGGASP